MLPAGGRRERDQVPVGSENSRTGPIRWPPATGLSSRPLESASLYTYLLDADDDLAQEIARVFSEEIYQELGSWSVWTRFSHLHALFRALIALKLQARRSAQGPGGTSLFDALAEMLSSPHIN